MSDQSRGGIYIVNPETGEAESVTSEELKALLLSDLRASKPEPEPEPEHQSEPPKPSPRKRREDLSDAIAHEATPGAGQD